MLSAFTGQDVRNTSCPAAARLGRGKPAVDAEAEQAAQAQRPRLYLDLAKRGRQLRLLLRAAECYRPLRQREVRPVLRDLSRDLCSKPERRWGSCVIIYHGRWLESTSEYRTHSQTRCTMQAATLLQGFCQDCGERPSLSYAACEYQSYAHYLGAGSRLLFNDLRATSSGHCKSQPLPRFTGFKSCLLITPRHPKPRVRIVGLQPPAGLQAAFAIQTERTCSCTCFHF